MTHISDIKTNLGIDIGIVPKIDGFKMQKHDDQHKLWALALAIYGSSKMAFNLKISNHILDVPKLSKTLMFYVLAYIQKLPNVSGDDIPKLDAHLAHAPMRLIAMCVDPKTKQASLILMSSFT